MIQPIWVIIGNRILCFLQKQDVWKYDWEGIHSQKRHDGNEHGF
jgi:hypothetical protein